ncbi:hypothetical protein BDW74DRAFT_30945 [Aspergillus multicolor]|uniref:uncharacterized protein n=1 Tax=Aspergillus multicolor TaxID=41759 RepID=UPI003CCD92B4
MAPSNPLTGFSRLTSQISLYTSPAQPSHPPTLIILCPWLFAAPRHIAKYTQLYQSTLPSADILLIQPVVGDMVWTTDSKQLHHLMPAVAAIDAFLDTTSHNHHLVIHAFSNAGSHAAVQLAEAYRTAHHDPSTDRQLPLTGLILDSSPGAPSALLSANAMILSLPRAAVIRALGAALIYAVVAIVAVLDFLGVYENVISKTRRVLNTPSSCFLVPGVRRVYLFSRADVMVLAGDVLGHAEEARRLIRLGAGSGNEDGSKYMIRTVEFMGSGHVGHFTVGKEEYTRAVLGVVDGWGVD